MDDLAWGSTCVMCYVRPIRKRGDVLVDGGLEYLARAWGLSTAIFNLVEIFSSEPPSIEE